MINFPENELCKAVEDDDLVKVRRMIAEGVDVNSINEDDEFPLLIASWSGSKEIVELLISNGANVNQAAEAEFYTALMRASDRGHWDIADILIKKGADVNARDDYDATSLTRAAESGHLEIVRLLLENGADPNIREERGKTARELAIENNHINAADLVDKFSIGKIRNWIRSLLK